MSYDRDAYDTARQEQSFQAARLVGYVRAMLEGGNIKGTHAAGLRRILVHYDRCEADMRAAVGLPARAA